VTILQVYASLNEGLGKMDAALDCRTKACRSIINKTGWEKDLESVAAAVRGLEALAQG
jgi:hypothetical protein